MVIFSVLGDEEYTIPCLPNDNVLLPCNCMGMNRAGGFKWQIETNHPFCFLHQSSEPKQNCTRRIITFQHDTIDNCSILLEKITETDNGTYKCFFFKPGYTRNIVHLGKSISRYLILLFIIEIFQWTAFFTRAMWKFSSHSKCKNRNSLSLKLKMRVSRKCMYPTQTPTHSCFSCLCSGQLSLT